MEKNLKFLFIFLYILLLFSANFCLALEVDYPALPNGSALPAGSLFSDYLKYIFDFGIFLGGIALIVSLAIAGVYYFISPALPSALSRAKDRAYGALSGFLILLLVYLIITTINPALAIFRFDKPDKITPQPQQKTAGVFLRNTTTCPEDSTQPITTSSPDLGLLKNRINAVNIVNNQDVAYITVLYDVINFYGKCQYINPNAKCQQVQPFATSASVYKYNFSPSGDGVFFYHKSFFNKDGGYYKITNSEIGPVYMKKLEDLRFTGSRGGRCTIPEKEQTCVKYDEKGDCAKRECQDLSGSSISSIEIKGDYLVILAYLTPTDSRRDGPWTFCQAYPKQDDANKTGPKQIKWDSIENNNGKLPNYVFIFPVIN